MSLLTARDTSAGVFDATPMSVEKALGWLASDDHNQRDEAEIHLLENGHEETAKKLAQRMLVNDGSTISIEYEWIRKEFVIPHLFDVFPNADASPPLSPPDRVLESSKVRICRAILSTISHKDSAYPEGTKAWSSLMIHDLPLSFEASEARWQYDDLAAWWEHNKGAILDGRPQDAAWLPKSPAEVDQMRKFRSSPVRNNEVSRPVRRTQPEREADAKGSGGIRDSPPGVILIGAAVAMMSAVIVTGRKLLGRRC